MVKSMSGIDINDDAAQLVQDISKKKTKVTVAFLRINDDNKIDFDSSLHIFGDFGLNDIVEKLKQAPTLPHWIVFLSTTKAIDSSNNTTKRTIETPMVISWCPDGCPVSHKMKFASSRGPVERAMGDCVTVQIESCEEMTPCEILGDRRMKRKLNGLNATEFCKISC